RIVYRDSLLVFLPLYALILALVMRLLVSFVPVADLGLYLAPAIVQFGSILLGTVLGFALIEEREQGTWLLLRVLPLRQSTLFLYLVAASTILSSVVGLAAAMVYGYPIADPVAFSWMLVAGSLLAPVVMLVLGVLATNKVEGLAVNKLVSISLLLPALVFVAPLPWQLVAAWLPGYWVYLGLLEAYAVDPSALSAVYWPNYPGWLLVAAPIALSLGGTIGLARAYMRRAS
ncbi:MAG TPA: hypothetical protein VEK15_30025, partial [Vicinamibacteria bacterium]|nr:hypothetical protein [Vicinamibacteria bacterium]